MGGGLLGQVLGSLFAVRVGHVVHLELGHILTVQLVCRPGNLGSGRGNGDASLCSGLQLGSRVPSGGGCSSPYLAPSCCWDARHSACRPGSQLVGGYVSECWEQLVPGEPSWVHSGDPSSVSVRGALESAPESEGAAGRTEPGEGLAGSMWALELVMAS